MPSAAAIKTSEMIELRGWRRVTTINIRLDELSGARRCAYDTLFKKLTSLGCHLTTFAADLLLLCTYMPSSKLKMRVEPVRIGLASQKV